MKKFLVAFNGLKIALTHRAVKIQLVLALFAIIGGIIIKLDYYEWIAFILCIFFVLFAEVFNTSIEQIGNYLTTENDERIRTIKDLSSSAVLISCICAFIVCLMCVIRRII